MHSALHGILDTLYPPRCEVCGRLRRELICEDCLATVELIESPVCEVCGEAFDPQTQAGRRCQRCRRGRRPFSAARSAAHYDGALVQAIIRFKYDCQMVLGRPLGALMVEALQRQPGAALDPDTVDVVSPVPLHAARLRERGFNQSELLAEEVAAFLGKPLKPLTERIRATLPQVSLPAQSRPANVRDAFAPRLEEVIAGQCVLLVDDLFTTGSTLEECARTLRRAEAREVRVFALARALPAWRRPGADARAAAEAATQL